MNRDAWKEKASCKGYEVNIFFDKYEEEEQFRPAVEAVCASCPVMRQCFAVGVSQKEWGVWGGVYLEGGKVSREFGRHRNKQQWGELWKQLTTDRG